MNPTLLWGSFPLNIMGVFLFKNMLGKAIFDARMCLH